MKLKHLAAALLPLFVLAGCSSQAYTADFFAMNTFMSVQVRGKAAQRVTTEVEQRVNALDWLLSRTRDESDISRLNLAGGEPVTLSPEAAALVGTAVQYAQNTDGAYDPTVAPLTDLWGIGTDAAHVPTQMEIDAARSTVGYQSVQFDGDTLRLASGAALDLGGIAKGYAADEGAKILRANGASGLLVLGGNIYAVGEDNGKPWKIGIGDPDNAQEYVATVALADLSVVTTGDYERFFEQDGVRYHHVFDTATGAPAQTDLRSVTVIGASSTQCDAYSTALFVMGRARGIEFCEQNGIAAIFITQDKSIYTTTAVRESCTFEMTGADKGYRDAS